MAYVSTRNLLVMTKLFKNNGILNTNLQFHFFCSSSKRKGSASRTFQGQKIHFTRI